MFPRDLTCFPDALVDLIPVDSQVTEAASKHRGVLSYEERQRLARFSRTGDAASHLVAHVYLRLVLGETLDRDPATLTFGRSRCPECGSASGRPTVEPFTGLEFSLSHTAGAIAVAQSSVAVGVDVQAVCIGGHSGVVEALHPDEANFLRGLGPGQRQAALARCWARNEAILKGLGSGVAHGVGNPLVGASENPGIVRGWCLYDVPVAPGWAAAVACEAPTGHNIGESHDGSC